MIQLTPNEIDNILKIIDQQTTIFVGSSLGEEYLSDSDKEKLKNIGVDYEKLYKLSNDPIFLNYQLGLISSVIGEQKAKSMPYVDLKKIIDSGAYIALNQREKAVINSVKMQTMSDIKSHGDKIFRDFNNIVNESNLKGRVAQEEFIREEISEGLEKRKTIQEIVRQLNNKTGDWSRDFNKIVQYVSHKALTEGRASLMRRKEGGNTKVYFHVQSSACKHCNRLYLTNGAKSQPKIFTLNQLEANGTNIGKKVNDWLATFSPLHLFCRCTLMEYEGGEWDGQKFVQTKEYESKVRKNKIKIKVGEKEYMI